MNAVDATAVTGAGAEEPGVAQRMRWLASDSIVIARRSLAHVRQIPEKLIDVTVQPLMFVILFAFVFGGAIAIPGSGDYHEYLMGGIFVQTLVFGLMGPATSMATDMKEGIVDRFRSLPMNRSAFIYGHLSAELVASLLAMAVMTIAGLIVGWRIHTGVGDVLAAYGLMLLLAMTMQWLGILLGIAARSPDAVTGVVFLVVFPLTFVANAFVPSGSLPDGLRQVAEYNPISAFAAALRTLFGNPTAIPDSAPWVLHHSVLTSVIWCVVLMAIAVPATLAVYRKRTTG